jgi:hypothetical protein
MGRESFPVGGTGGGWKLLFGELAEVGEEMLPFEVLACSVCRRVELRVPGRSDQGTIFEIGSSRMSVAPAAFSSGISRFTPRFSTTASIA